MRSANNFRPDFEIWIENLQFRHQEGNIAVATYEEWQTITGGETNARLSTVVFREETGTPNGLVWLHVYEMWLEG